MRKTTAFSIAILTLSTAALAQVGTTPGDQTMTNNTTATDNSSGSNTTTSTDNTTTPDTTDTTTSNAM